MSVVDKDVYKLQLGDSSLGSEVPVARRCTMVDSQLSVDYCIKVRCVSYLKEQVKYFWYDF